jgi:hypothetical protein
MKLRFLLAFAAGTLPALLRTADAEAQTPSPAPPAPAQPAPDPNEPDRIRAAHTATRDPAILLDLAASLRRLGRHAAAAMVYEEWKRDPRADPSRAAEVNRAILDIDNYVGRLTIQFDDPYARISLDGRELPGFQSGAMVRVDPGDHQVSAVSGTRPAATGGVHLDAREVRTVELRLGTYIPPTASPPVPVVVPVLAPQPAPSPPPPPATVDGARLTGTLLLVGGGLTLAAGVAAGIAAISLEAEARSHCLGGGAACEQAGVDLQRQARTAGSACTIVLGSGAAVLLAGIIVRAATGGRGHRGALPAHLHAGAEGVGVTW